MWTKWFSKYLLLTWRWINTFLGVNYSFKAIESQQTTFKPHCTTTETPNAQSSHPEGFDRYRQLGGPRDVKLIFTLHPHSFCLFTCFLSITSSFNPLIPHLTPFSLHSCVVLQNVCNLVLEFHCTRPFFPSLLHNLLQFVLMFIL